MIKKQVLLACALLAVASIAICSDDQTLEPVVKKSRKRSEKLYTTTKAWSAANVALLCLAFSKNSDDLFQLWLKSSMASILAHGALLYKSKDYPQLNKISVGVGLALNPVILLEMFYLAKKHESLLDPKYVLFSLFAAGAIKACYDAYDYFARSSDYESEDESAVSGEIAENIQE